MFEDGTTAERTFQVGATSRFNVAVSGRVPGAQSAGDSARSSRVWGPRPPNSSSSAPCIGTPAASCGRPGPTPSRRGCRDSVVVWLSKGKG